MEITITLPQAFSVRDEHEFVAHGHLVERMNPKLRIVQVATGMHKKGGCTVYWGIVYSQDEVPGSEIIKAALAAAGFDFEKSNRPNV